MSNNVLLITLLFFNVSFSQTLNERFITYETKNIENHYLTFIKDTLIVTIPHRKGTLFSEQIFFLKTQKEKNIISLDSNKLNSSYYKLKEKLSKSKIIIKRDNHLITSYKQPYYKKKYVDSLNNASPIIVLNKKTYTQLDSLELQNKINCLLKNEKKIKSLKVKKLNSKKAYEKYGAIGLYGAVECSYKF